MSEKNKNLLLIIIPRHINRIENLLNELSDFKMPIHLHSSRNKINKKTKIYLVDTYGETDLFFETSKIVFMGKSLTVDGGQNPLEAARKNCFIIHGIT